ncbi:RNA polymerase sigma-70 factor (ECF subfamily) [Dyadobacter jejuensis]|uniref:RNA polymerase sigma-70 factor (ECF subfamily) n=1 Tax=Dyadobacter jejuensis TaxID=1082580 RepID=A0A316AMN0_9BACT|nr:sigma-70 family RNA polymerase sigma factor [Dyadobacter jejuensis]PWJ58792.1 RNA polymerase sigma-70 factor (ECF subfamily) [Dyadobacter jejuensis]
MKQQEEVGEHQATEWVNTHGDALYAFAVTRIKDKELSKDLVQETFIAAWKGFKQFRGEASVKSWLFSILKNKIADHFRRQKWSATEIGDYNDQDPFFDAHEHWAKTTSPKTWEDGADTLLENQEFYKVLDYCQGKLNTIQRAVFSLKYVEEMGTDMITDELNLSQANYWVIMHRAKLQLRACMESNWFITR